MHHHKRHRFKYYKNLENLSTVIFSTFSYDNTTVLQKPRLYLHQKTLTRNTSEGSQVLFQVVRSSAFITAHRAMGVAGDDGNWCGLSSSVLTREELPKEAENFLKDQGKFNHRALVWGQVLFFQAKNFSTKHMANAISLQINMLSCCLRE